MFVLSTLLVLMLIAITVYVNMANKSASQLEQIGKIQKEYQVDDNKMDEEYNNNIEPVDDLEIGATVVYKPRGTYNWIGEYSYDKWKNDVILNSNNEAYKIYRWRVLDIDRSAQKVNLVPETIPTGQVNLTAHQGYNNGVKLLNDACNSLYGNESKGITARNINIEDLETKLTSEALKEAHSYANYGQKAPGPYPIGNIGFPAIYKEEKSRIIDGVETIAGLKPFEQNNFINFNDKVYRGAKTMQPYANYYTLYDLETKLSLAPNGIRYYDLLLPLKEKTRYWIASRMIFTGEIYDQDNGPLFYFRYMNGRN